MRIEHRSLLRNCTFALVAVAALVFSGGLSAQTGGVEAHDAWIRVPAPSKTETALYMVIENHTSQPRAVVSASSDAAAKLEMHEMKMVKQDQSMPKSDNSMSMGGNGSSMGQSNSSMGQSSMAMSAKPSDQSMMVMMPIHKIVIPANGKATLAPNGLHIMMFGLKSRPAAGDKINVTLKLDDGTTVPVVATVR